MSGLYTVASIISFLNDLSREQRDQLYESPWTCQAVFRSLPPLAKNYVLRLLLIDVPIPQGALWGSHRSHAFQLVPSPVMQAPRLCRRGG